MPPTTRFIRTALAHAVQPEGHTGADSAAAQEAQTAVQHLHLCRQRHLVESAFLNLKQWRGIATRYAKNLPSFLAAVQIRCAALWLEIS